jgi:hypothetical protein
MGLWLWWLSRGHRDHAKDATNSSRLADRFAEHIGESVRLAQDGAG